MREERPSGRDGREDLMKENKDKYKHVSVTYGTMAVLVAEVGRQRHRYNPSHER